MLLSQHSTILSLHKYPRIYVCEYERNDTAGYSGRIAFNISSWSSHGTPRGEEIDHCDSVWGRYGRLACRRPLCLQRLPANRKPVRIPGLHTRQPVSGNPETPPSEPQPCHRGNDLPAVHAFLTAFRSDMMVSSSGDFER